MNPKLTSEPDDSTVYGGAATPPETVADDIEFIDNQDPFGKANLSASSIPWPGSSFIIRSVATGDVITLLDGQVLMAPPGGRGSIHWACVENKGWIGFRSPITGRFLGHDKQGKLRCEASRHEGWENFCVRLRPEGGYVLLMTHWERLWNVGIRIDGGLKRLAKIEDSGLEGNIWEFVKV